MDILAVLTRISDAIWSAPVIFALLSFLRTYPGKRAFRSGISRSVSAQPFSGTSGVYKSLSVSLAAVLGVGNIVGVALAISLGGAGAVFWCWLAGLVGVGVQYAECLFSLKYRGRGKDGTAHGGPMYTMRATGHRGSGLLYALAVCLCGIAMGALIPANSICEVLSNNGHFPAALVSAVITILAAVVILGGAKMILTFAPALSRLSLYCISAFAWRFFFICRGQLGSALSLIVTEAFNPVCAVTGVTGYGVGRAARWGVARGLFFQARRAWARQVSARPRPATAWRRSRRWAAPARPSGIRSSWRP